MGIFNNINSAQGPVGLVLAGTQMYVERDCIEWARNNIHDMDRQYRRAVDHNPDMTDEWIPAGTGTLQGEQFDEISYYGIDYIFYIRQSPEDPLGIDCKIALLDKNRWIVIQWGIKLDDRLLSEMERVAEVNKDKGVDARPRVNIDIKSITISSQYINIISGNPGNQQIKSESGNDLVLKSYLVMNAWDEYSMNVMNGWWDFDSEREMMYTIPAISKITDTNIYQTNPYIITPIRERVVNGGYIV